MTLWRSHDETWEFPTVGWFSAHLELPVNSRYFMNSMHLWVSKTTSPFISTIHIPIYIYIDRYRYYIPLISSWYLHYCIVHEMPWNWGWNPWTFTVKSHRTDMFHRFPQHGAAPWRVKTVSSWPGRPLSHRPKTTGFPSPPWSATSSPNCRTTKLWPLGAHWMWAASIVGRYNGILMDILHYFTGYL